MWGYFYIEFIDFMLKSKSLLDYTNLFSPIKRIINNTKIFSITQKAKMEKLYCIISGKYRKFKNPKIAHISQKC